MASDSVNKLIIGCGYLGRRVAAEWLALGQSVAALTRSEANAAVLRRGGILPHLGDVTDPESLASLPRADTILYAVGFDRTAGRSRRDVSVDGLASVLRAINSRVVRFLYVSSTSVYGQSAGEWIDEASPAGPTQPNGQVCLEAEQLVREQLPQAIVLRLAGLYGPGRLLRRLDELKSAAPIAGNPQAWLNLVHVDDAVASVLAAEERGRPGATYLVCDDRPIRRREYYELLARLSGAPPPVFAEGDPAGRTDHRDFNKRCSNRKLREELCVRLQFPTIGEGLPDALAGVQS
ncbi:MAG TPA: SDR family oxidoreductase [Planctomycetaceae bacterium]|nr:SDR family oxidoreductase [Planctomycetaceae bacterium]